MFQGAIEKFLECLAARNANLCGQDQSLGEVWDVLARCYAMQGSSWLSDVFGLEHSNSPSNDQKCKPKFCDETTVPIAHDEMHAKTQSSICCHRQSAQLDFP